MIAFPPGFILSPPSIPEHRGDPQAEYDALGHDCGRLDAPWERLLRVEGEEAVEFLQSMLTQDVAGLPSGKTRPAALADRRGRWLSDLWVHRDGDRFFLRLRADRLAAVCEVLERHRFSSRVRWDDPAPDARPFLLLGPRAPAVLRAISLDEPREDREGGRLAAAAGGFWMAVREVGAEDRVVFPTAAEAGHLLARWAASSQPPREVGSAAFHARRIEAGTPWHGLDGDETRLVSECVPEDRVSFTKGCFLGQETLARAHYRGRLRRRLARLVVSAETQVEWGDELLDEDGSPAGRLRSAARRPDGSFVAFALREEGARGLRVRLRRGGSGRWLDEKGNESAPSP